MQRALPRSASIGGRGTARGVRAGAVAAEIERIAGDLGSLLWLAFSGGEPFLRRSLPEINRLFYRHHQPARDHALPHQRPDARADRRADRTDPADCRAALIMIKLSLDGVGERDRLRGTPGGFAKVIET